MKFFLATILTAFFSTIALAQNVQIGFPFDGDSIPAGSNFTVEIDKQNTISQSQEVAIVIGLQDCPNIPCFPPDQVLRTILYNGPYSPQQAPPETHKFPHQNFTLFVPADFPKGNAQLGVAHAVLVGANEIPTLQTLSIALNIV